jgi:hypothetical protein
VTIAGESRPPRTRRARAVSLLAVAVALAAAVAPLPAAWVERVYSRGLYPRIQSVVTPVSALTSIALLDAAVALLLTTALVLVVGRARTHGARAALVRALAASTVAAAIVYLWFLLFWGLNYRRVPLEQKLVYDPSRITRDQGLQLARTAVERVNGLVDGAKAAPPDDPTLMTALNSVRASLGETPLAIEPRPKRSLLTLYFRRAAIDGMTDPFFLEVIVNADLLPSERPFVLAHEWAHIGGYADESEANFISWLTCMRASPAAQYSGWLAAYQHISSGLPPADRRMLAATLSRPVRMDLAAERERFTRSSPVVRAAAQGAYDTYLRANRIEEGIANYNAVVRLMLGVSLDDRGNPRLR